MGAGVERSQAPAASLQRRSLVLESAQKRPRGLASTAYHSTTSWTSTASRSTTAAGRVVTALSSSKEQVKDALSVSHSNSLAKLAVTVALGSLTGSSEIDRHVVGGGAETAIKWEDTFTITSKKLKSKTPVSLKATLQIAGKPAPCMGNGTGYYWASEQLSITTTYSGLEYVSECAAPQEILKATVKTYVGATFTESEIYSVELGVDPYVSSCPSCKPDFKYESGTLTASYHLDPITSGASYITASGKSYK